MIDPFGVQGKIYGKIAEAIEVALHDWDSKEFRARPGDLNSRRSDAVSSDRPLSGKDSGALYRKDAS